MAVVAETKKRVNTKPRKDKGGKHASGAARKPHEGQLGRPPRVEDKALKARMQNLSNWLTNEAACIKPNGIAGLAGITAPDLSNIRSGAKPLHEPVVAALEKAATRYKYNPKTTY